MNDATSYDEIDGITKLRNLTVQGLSIKLLKATQEDVTKSLHRFQINWINFDHRKPMFCRGTQLNTGSDVLKAEVLHNFNVDICKLWYMIPIC